MRRIGNQESILPLVFGVAFVVIRVSGLSADETIRLVTEFKIEACEPTTPDQLEIVAQTLDARLTCWRIPHTVEVQGTAVVARAARHEAGEERDRLRRVLTARGGFALHDVESAPLGQTTAPAGYELPVWAYEREEMYEYFIKPEVGFTAVPSEPPQLVPPAVEWDKTRLAMPLAVEDRGRLADYTESRYGQFVGVVIDGRLWAVPRIGSRIFGDLYLPMDTTEVEIRVLAALAAAPPLDVCVEIKEETAIDEAYSPPAPPSPREPIIDAAAIAFYEEAAAIADCDRKRVPTTARVEFRGTVFWDEEAVAEYCWQAPDRECARTTISYLRANEALTRVASYGVTAEQVIEYLESSTETIIDLMKSSGRIMVGHSSLLSGTGDQGSSLFEMIEDDLHLLIDGRQVDVLYESHPAGRALIVRGVDYGEYHRQEVQLWWFPGDACLDSVTVSHPESDMRIRVDWNVFGDAQLPVKMTITDGLPGDHVRDTTVTKLEYRQVEGYWLATRMIVERAGGTETAFELVDAKIDIPLGEMDWADEVTYVDREELIEVYRVAEEKRRQKRMEIYRKLKDQD